MTTTRTLRLGDRVTFRDENGRSLTGRVHSFSQANDGTGRHGVHVEAVVGGHHHLYWRERRQVRRA